MAWRGVHAFRCPTEILYGRGAAGRTGAVLRGLGVRSALVVCDEMISREGILDEVRASIEADGVDVVPCVARDRAITDPADVDEVVEIGRAAGCDGVVGLGGGRAMTLAKAAAFALGGGAPVRRYVGRDTLDVEPLPVVCVATRTGTGAEVTGRALLVDVARHVSLPLYSSRLTPRAAIVDPELVGRAEPELLAASGAQALSGAVESYVNRTCDPLVGSLCIGAVRELGASLRDAVGGDPDAIDRVALAGTMAGLASSQNANAIVQAASVPVSSRFAVTHGVAMAVLLEPGIRFCLPGCEERLADVGEALGRERSALAALEALRALMDDVGLPRTFKQTGVDWRTYMGAIGDMVGDALHTPDIALTPRLVKASDLKSLYLAAYG